MTAHMREFFQAMQEILLAGDPKPQRKPTCPYCNGTGTRGDNMCNRCDTFGNVELEGDDDDY